MKNISPGDHRHCIRLRFSVPREEAKMDGTSLSYKFSDSVDLGKNRPMFSRRFSRFGAGIHIASTRDFAQSRVFIAAGSYHSAKRCSKYKLEAS